MTTRASRTVSQGLVSLNPRSRELFAFGFLTVCFLAASTLSLAQDASDDAQAIVVAEHWSPYQAPTSYPEGTQLHIIVDGDTLWAISGQYLDNPYLWPQLWDANRYIDIHTLSTRETQSCSPTWTWCALAMWPASPVRPGGRQEARLGLVWLLPVALLAPAQVRRAVDRAPGH